MKKLLKKRQLILATLVVALGAAMFINWYYTKPAVETDAKVITTVQNMNVSEDERLGDSQYVHNPYSSSASEYFAGAKLKRSAAHDEAKETLNAVITDTKSNDKAVAAASKSLQELADAIKLESDCESLITAKTGSECLVMIGDGSAQAILGGKPIDSAMALQIKEVLMSKTKIAAENITIVELEQ
ncbi:MAG: SpoIIIAH-like family protein [Oscillospiraceae bacterium]|jgi:stage III sporulation protein AH|nr:SpoIIIAH-like family protein [Oscillospiraceae bacterium]